MTAVYECVGREEELKINVCGNIQAGDCEMWEAWILLVPLSQ